VNWNDLKKPFDVKSIGVRVGAVSPDRTRGIPMLYISARDVMDRLDEVAGPENWEFDCELLHCNSDTVAVRGVLTVHGVTRCDVGEAATETEPFKSAVSDALKRCAVHFGIGRYLYSVPSKWYPLDQNGRFIDQERIVQELHNAAINGSNGSIANETSTQNMSPKPAQTNMSTIRQQETIEKLRQQLFSDRPEMWQDFMEHTINRYCKTVNLTKSEASSLISAMLKMLTENSDDDDDYPPAGDIPGDDPFM